MPNATVDPRLGPYAGGVLGPNRTVRFAYEFDLPPGGVPAGGGLEVEFRGAGAVDAAPWRAVQEQYPTSPDAENFPLDPLKATDAHIRKYDDRPVGGIPRDYWTYLYNRNITDYTDDPADLMDASFLSSFAGPNETFTPADVRYFNWRFVLRNGPSGAPTIDSFAVSYRIEAR